jgi:hypothetical protein
LGFGCLPFFLPLDFSEANALDAIKVQSVTQILINSTLGPCDLHDFTLPHPHLKMGLLFSTDQEISLKQIFQLVQAFNSHFYRISFLDWQFSF